MANLAVQAVTGVDAVSLVNTIISSARKAAAHRRNCEQLAEHVKMIGNLLEKLKSTDLVSLPAIKEPLDCLEEALKKALDLVESCRDKSYLYMLAMGWSVVYQFRQVQAEIGRYLRLVPLISLVHEFRMQDGLQAIEADQREYTLDEEDVQAQNVILKPDRSKKDASILENSLSRKYPELGFQEALLEEKEKLHIELQRSRTNNDTKQCQLIEHLIDVTENVVNELPGKKLQKLVANEPTYVISGYVTNAVNSGYGDPGSKAGDESRSEWEADLFCCLREPCLTREQAINTLMAHSIFCGCCCYSCCIRTKLRETFNIQVPFSPF
ncbi:Mid1-complementing activity 1 [Citrus sinensis]|uniref:Mid1-complementing activity 1 n=1 Tax=Citrus sinensis TaxID=2711 RepID=A0ACB8L1D6_CITSI|nr:Mid1-complementing activity 1 [Citrus sinensis]